MAPFGKIHSAVNHAGDRVKAGLAYVNHRYQQGVGLAQRVNEYMHVGRKVAGLMMPVLDKMHPDLAPRLNAGIGALDRLRDTAVSHHDDVMAKISHNASMVKDMRDAFQPVQSYMNSV